MRSPRTAQQLKAFLRDTLGAFPWRIRVSDWTGQQYSLGLGEPHWRGLPLEVHLRSKAAGHDLLSGQGSEVVLGCEILNRMTALGRPVSYRIGR